MARRIKNQRGVVQITEAALLLLGALVIVIIIYLLWHGGK